MYGTRQPRVRYVEGRRKTSGKCTFQVHFPLAATGKIIRKIERKTVALIGGTGEPLSVYFLFGFHQGEAQPRVCSGNKFTEQFHVDTGGVTFGKVASVITNPYIIYIIRYEIAQCFVIHFHGEAERTVHGTEIIVATCHEVQERCERMSRFRDTVAIPSTWVVSRNSL